MIVLGISSIYQYLPGATKFFVKAATAGAIGAAGAYGAYTVARETIPQTSYAMGYNYIRGTSAGFRDFVNAPPNATTGGYSSYSTRYPSSGTWVPYMK